MSRNFLVAVGGLLVVLGGMLGIVALGVGTVPMTTALPMVAIPTLLGCAALAAGLRNPYGRAYRHLIVRRADPFYFWMGLALIAASILVMPFGLWDLLPQRLVGSALVGVPIGVFMMARFIGNACARCGKRLRSVRLGFPGADMRTAMGCLRAGDVPSALTALKTPASSVHMSGRFELEYCPACQAVAVCRASGEWAVLEGTTARSAIGALPSPAALKR